MSVKRRGRNRNLRLIEEDAPDLKVERGERGGETSFPQLETDGEKEGEEKNPFLFTGLQKRKKRSCLLFAREEKRGKRETEISANYEEGEGS